MSIGRFDLLEVHGNNGLILHDEGTLVTDRYLLDTCTAVFKIRKDNWGQMPTVGAGHPIFGWILMEKRELSFEDAWAVGRCSYAGIVKDTTPVYETVIGVTESPISTNPKFVTDIAGTPSKPLNGAIFRYVGGGLKLPPATADYPAQGGDSGYVFDSFEVINSSGDLNDFAKLTSFMDPSGQTFRKTYNTTDPTIDISAAGYIDVPDGPAPDLGGNRNYLNMGYTITQRGAATQVVVDWRASGPRGWNKTIYTK